MDDLGEVVCNSGISAMFRSCVAWDNCFVTVARKRLQWFFMVAWVDLFVMGYNSIMNYRIAPVETCRS